MKTLKFLIKLTLFCLPFLGFIVIPVVVGELVPIQFVVEQQQNSKQDFLFGPQFIWRDNLFAYRVETINYRKPEILVLGSSRTTNIRADVFDKQPDVFYNASVEGFNIGENERLLYSINADALPNILLLGMNQNLMKAENILLDTTRPTQLSDEIPIDELVLGTVFRTLEDMLTEGDFVEMGLAREPIYSDTTLFGTRAHTFGHGYLADGSTRNRVVEQWSRSYITQETRRDRNEMTNRENKFRPGETVNQAYLAKIEGMLQYAQEHEIQVVGFLPPFAPEFYEELVASDDFEFMFEASRQLAELFSEYDAYYFDFTSPYYFRLGERNFRDSWHSSDYIMSQIILTMAWASPDLFDPYLSLTRLAETITDTTDPNLMFFEGGERVNPAVPSATVQLIEASIAWDVSFIPAIRAYNRALFSPNDTFDGLERTLSRTIETYPDLAMLYLWRAQVYLRSEQPSLLTQDVATALEIDPDIDVPLRLLGVYLTNSGESGREQINDVIARNPDASWAYLARADLRFADGDYQAARDDYLISYQLERTPDNRDGYINSLIELGDVDGVLAFMNSAFQGTGDDLVLLERRAEIYTELAYYDEAIRDYQRAYNLTDRTNPTYIVRQGDVYTAAGQYDTAIMTYENAADFFDNPGYIYARLGDVYSALADTDTALDYYQQAIDSSPSNIVAYIRLMDYHIAQEDYDSAIEMATQAIDNGNAEAWIYGRRGRYYREIEEYELALADFLSMSELEPNDLGHHYFVGDAYFQLEQYDEAQVWLERAVTIGEPVIGTFARLADIYEMEADYLSAIDMMERALVLYPDEDWLRDRLASYTEALVTEDASFTN